MVAGDADRECAEAEAPAILLVTTRLLDLPDHAGIHEQDLRWSE
jgi:hypothetical protein